MAKDSIWQRFTSARFAAICGIAGPLVAIIGILTAIGISASWFNWFIHALSDLGHPFKLGGSSGIDALNPAAPIFNGALIACGIITLPLAFRLILGRDHKSVLGSIGGVLLLISQFFLIGIGAFNEAFGNLHFLVSVGFFVFILLFDMIYGISMMVVSQTRWFGVFPFILAIIGATVWGAHFLLTVPWTGEAIPEIISALGTIAWVFPLCIRLYQHGD